MGLKRRLEITNHMPSYIFLTSAFPNTYTRGLINADPILAVINGITSVDFVGPVSRIPSNGSRYAKEKGAQDIKKETVINTIRCVTIFSLSANAFCFCISCWDGPVLDAL